MVQSTGKRLIQSLILTGLAGAGVSGCNGDDGGSASEVGSETAGSETAASTTTTSETTTSGSGGSAPEAPVLELGFSQIKQFNFSWAPALGAQYYRLLEQNVGDADHEQVGADIIGTSTSRTVPLHQRLGSTYVLEACNDWGCTASPAVEVVGTLAEAVGYVKASNTGEDWFGAGVALSGDGRTLAVRAHLEDSSATGINGNQANNAAENAGAVYVFVRDDLGVWTQQAYIKASNTEANDQFGSSVALSGDGRTLAVGAWFEDSGATGINGNQADNSVLGSGAVYVFTRDDLDTWTQQAYVKASNTNFRQWFGASVALSGDGSTLAVGANQENSKATGVDGDQTDTSADEAGAVYVFVRDDLSAWTQQAYIKASNTDAEDQFGGSVALSGDGNTLAVGAFFEDSSATGINGNEADNAAAAAGAAYVFVRDDLGVWSQRAYIKASNTEESDVFGGSVALSGDGSTLAVGARGESSKATGINGDQANDTVGDSGAAYVFVRDDLGVWTQQAYVKASNTGGWLGISVALSSDGSTLAIGANKESSNAGGVGGNQLNISAYGAGAVYVMVRDDLNVWKQQAYVKAPNPERDDEFGTSVALSGDGSTLTVGAQWEDSNATGIGGDQANNSATNAGAVYIY
jgi:hypothetical protein